VNTYYLRSWFSLVVLILLDRGWGRAPQPHAGEDRKDIRVTIRNIVEGKE
jgi:hypothetical protein